MRVFCIMSCSSKTHLKPAFCFLNMDLIPSLMIHDRGGINEDCYKLETLDLCVCLCVRTSICTLTRVFVCVCVSAA